MIVSTIRTSEMGDIFILNPYLGLRLALPLSGQVAPRKSSKAMLDFLLNYFTAN